MTKGDVPAAVYLDVKYRQEHVSSLIEDRAFRAEQNAGLSVNGKPPVSKTGTPRSSRGRPASLSSGLRSIF